MKKLRLDLDALVVESFRTALDGAARGTIAGNLDIGIGVPKSQSNCADCNYTIPPSCMSCGEPVCPIGSATECPSCFNSCNSCVCPEEPIEIGPVQPRNPM